MSMSMYMLYTLALFSLGLLTKTLNRERTLEQFLIRVVMKFLQSVVSFP